MIKRYLHPACLSLLLICNAGAATAEVVLVVGKQSPIESLSRHEINDIFLGNVTRLPNVGKIVPLDRSEDKVRAEFYQDYTGKTLPQVKAHWAKHIFTGRGYPPKTVSSVEELKQILRSNPNAIGYAAPDKVDESMRVLTMK
jgi:ABC-type phosphate transport system substrate-binding protein